MNLTRITESADDRILLIQWHFERRYQQIFTLTYDFSPALSLGSRLIWQADGINIYFALRRSGYAGTDCVHLVSTPFLKIMQPLDI